MNTSTCIRLDILSAAVRAIAAALPADRAHEVELAIRAAADDMAGRSLSPDTDAALASELTGLLSSLTRTPVNLRPCA